MEMIHRSKEISVNSVFRLPKTRELFVYYGNTCDINIDGYSEALPIEEQIRSNQILLKEDRDLFLASRFYLRKILGEIVSENPKEIEIEYGKYDKPFLKNFKNLHFNVSHTNKTFVIGIASQELGIDIESVNRQFNIEKLSSFLFSKCDLDTFNQLDSGKKVNSFINCWTRKEAILKAKGCGLSVPVNEFEVTFLPDELPEIKHLPFESHPLTNWFLKSFKLKDQIIGAIAVNGDINSVEYIDITKSSG